MPDLIKYSWQKRISIKLLLGVLVHWYEWVVMTFELKNAIATYQRAMNYIFHELIGKIVEIYIDDVALKSKGYQEHLEDLKRTLMCARKHGLRMNPHKCAFCWHFLASLLKIDHRSILSNGTRNVGCWHTVTIATSER